MGRIIDKCYIVANIPGASYTLPNWRIGPNGIEMVENSPGQRLDFLRTNSGDIVHQEGIIHEGLLAMMIYDLRLKNKEVPNGFNKVAIEHLESALKCMEDRQKDREQRGVRNTKEK